MQAFQRILLMKWVQQPLPNESAVRTLVAQGKNLHPALARVLVLRGVSSPAHGRRYFRDTLADLADPLLMDGMSKAAQRLAQAVTHREHITVYGDFDADGVTSVALMRTFLSRCGAPSSHFVISRTIDGRGLVRRGIDHAIAQGARVLLVLDCGTANVDETAYALGKGLDVIICDHHEPGPKLPEATAIVNPKKPGCPYPFKGLSACGIAFRLVQATAAALKRDPKSDLDLLELVALATVADVVPLREENRILVRAGLDVLRNTARPGLRALASAARVDLAHIEADDIAWRLAPRLNAACRMDSAEVAVDLLLAERREVAEKHAHRLDALNDERKETTKELYDVARKQATVQAAGEHNGVLVLKGRAWHAGVLGIVASRLVQEFSRPAVMLSTNGATAAGSARSFGRINLYNALTSCKELLLHYGGHAGAAGLKLRVDDILAFRKALSTYVKKRLSKEDLEIRMNYDAVLSLGDIDRRFSTVVQHLQPCGRGNEAPVFLSHDVVARSIRRLRNAHLKFSARQANEPGGTAKDVIAFNFADRYEDIRGGKPFDMLFTIEQNHFMGRTTTQLTVQDIRASHTSEP